MTDPFERFELWRLLLFLELVLEVSGIWLLLSSAYYDFNLGLVSFSISSSSKTFICWLTVLLEFILTSNFSCSLINILITCSSFCRSLSWELTSRWISLRVSYYLLINSNLIFYSDRLIGDFPIISHYTALKEEMRSTENLYCIIMSECSFSCGSLVFLSSSGWD